MEKKPTRTDRYFIGLDLGKLSDFTALSVVGERRRMKPLWRQGQPDCTWPVDGYELRHLERYELGTPYRSIARQVTALIRREPLRSADTRLIVDRGGVGEAVFELLQDELKGSVCRPVGVAIHGGDRISGGGAHLRVPKRDLVGSLQVAVQNGDVQAAEGLPLWETLRSEMQNFTAELKPTGHDTYEARVGEHDDLVLSLALAIWHAGWSNDYSKLTPVKATMN